MQLPGDHRLRRLLQSLGYLQVPLWLESRLLESRLLESRLLEFHLLEFHLLELLRCQWLVR
jgi:hypothetical protein